MIKATNIVKTFDDGIKAVDDVSCQIQDSSIFGLIGSNGAGKSTFLRILAGILKPDSGEIQIDNQNVYENEAVKGDFVFISDDQFFFPNVTPKGMMNYFSTVYPKFSKEKFLRLMKNFELDPNRRVKTFSKGMKKQVSIILALSANTKYIFCDETFDGLDPVARQAVKSLFAAHIADTGATIIIASHNLRELEDVCDHVGLLHRGGILFSRDIDDMKLNIHKAQCIFKEEVSKDDFEGIDIISLEQRGSLYTITARGDAESVKYAINAKNPMFFELLPLSLEEIFISETEVFGYDIKKLIV